MAINTMGFEDASVLIAALHTQVTGLTSSAPVDTSSFVSMAQATLQAGYEPVLNAITQVMNKTMIAVRPYSRKFKGLELTRERWGGIIRKINFGESALDIASLDGPSDPTFSLEQGASIDQWVVKKPQVLETRYVGQDVYESSYTIFTKQLDTAFSGPEEFAAFMSGLMTHFSNEREQYLESLSRAIICNLIGAKKVLADDGIDLQVIDLLAEYNTATGQSLTATTVKLPANYPAFAKWAYAYIQHVSEMFTERGVMFQRPLTDYFIARHTPKADQRLYMDADFLAHMTAEVLADVYHDNFLRYSEVEAVNFWQTAKDPSTVNVKPVYLNGDAEFVNADDAVEISGVLGVLMDRDAAGYNIADDSLVTSPYNAKGQYYNIFDHVRVQLQNDLTEKAVVFLIGAGENPNPPVPSGTKLYEGTITTVNGDYGNFSDEIALNPVISEEDYPLTLSVIFNGETYTLPSNIESLGSFGEFSEGLPVFTTYPLAVYLLTGDDSDYETFSIATETAGTYNNVVIVKPEETVIFNSTFSTSMPDGADYAQSADYNTLAAFGDTENPPAVVKVSYKMAGPNLTTTVLVPWDEDWSVYGYYDNDLPYFEILPFCIEPITNADTGMLDKLDIFTAEAVNANAGASMKIVK